MTQSGRLDLSHASMSLVFSLADGPSLERWERTDGCSRIEQDSPLFSIHADGHHLEGSSSGATVRHASVDRTSGGPAHASFVVGYDGTDLEATLHVVLYPDTALVEQWVVLRNRGLRSARIDRIESLVLRLPPAEYRLLAFQSAWGAEFDGRWQPLDAGVTLQSQSGRSSQGMHPFFVLSSDEAMIGGAIAWSGNWAARFEPHPAGCRVSAGLNAWKFALDLAAGESFEAPHVALALAPSDLDAVSQQYHRAGRRYWYPSNALSRSLPVEWNHWWSYEDAEIDEATFRANVDAAAALGLDLCTLDAGWFGPSERGSAWTEHRGDWAQVNGARFPSGLAALSDHVHARGMRFGLWCEIEGIGERSELRRLHPEYEATRSGRSLGYLCFGSEPVRRWALDTLARLIQEYGCDWLKLDFNLDPGPGCDRNDHDHGHLDGLVAHYHGYYAVLDRLRAEHPEVVLENCSSGGLRIDLGIMRHTHLTFLSDADWPEHNLQVFWGATLMLAPEVCLHWGPSQWRTPHPHQTFDPLDPRLTSHQVDYALRTALLGAAGLSLRLPELPAWVAERIVFHVTLYHERIRRFVRDGCLYRLTDQPRRDGTGDRWCAFQYELPGEHLLAAFRLPGGEPTRSLLLRNLKPNTTYSLRWIDDREERHLGMALMSAGLNVTCRHEAESALAILSEEKSRS